MKLFTSQELCSIAEQEELRVNEADRNGTIANGTSNGAIGTCNGTNSACNGEIGVNGATPVTNGSLTGHENANFEKNKLEIQVESESQSTKKVTDKETTSMLNLSRLVRKPTMWFPNRSGTNQTVQSQKQTRSLNFRI